MHPPRSVDIWYYNLIARVRDGRIARVRFMRLPRKLQH